MYYEGAGGSDVPDQPEGYGSYLKHLPEALFNLFRGDDTEGNVVRKNYDNEHRAECNDGRDNEWVHLRPVSCFSLTHKNIAIF